MLGCDGESALRSQDAERGGKTIGQDAFGRDDGHCNIACQAGTVDRINDVRIALAAKVEVLFASAGRRDRGIR